MYLSDKGLLFAHIPKTAGTSFRRSVERYVRGWKVYSDYSESNATTSRIIRKLYQSDDFSKINEINGKNTLLAGHYPVKKYLPYYPISHVITFVRDPVQRVISHYHDMQRRVGYPETLETFSQEKKYQNQQSKFFRDVPVEAIGFVGICEFYDESIDLIRQIYNINVPVKKYNENEEKKNVFYMPADEIINKIKEENQDDWVLYEKSLHLFKVRQGMSNDNKSYVYGKITTITSQGIKGWAFDPLGSMPVKLSVKIDGIELKKIIADEETEGLEFLNLPNNAAIGFSCIFNTEIASTKKVEVIVEGVGQTIY
jgi:hypothetical protein